MADLPDTIYVVRHGFRLNWVTVNWSSPTGLPRDPPLAAFGEIQADELAAYFSALPPDERPTALLCSPYYRCLQTAAPIAAALSLPILVEPGLAEWYSPVVPGTGLHPRPAPAAALRAHAPAVDPAWAPLHYPPRRGETPAQLHARAAAVLAALVPALARRAPPPARVILMTHAATAIALTRALVGDPGLPLRVGCATITELARRPGVESVCGAWEARRLADGAHLKEGSGRDWGFEDIQIADGEVIPDPGIPGTENEVDEPVGPQTVLSNL